MANNFIIDPKSIDNFSIKAKLRAFLDQAPDKAKWKDFFESSAGQTVIELLAGLGAFYSYQTIVARREGFLLHVENRSSAIGHAQSQGYSIFKGRNSIVKLTVVADNTLTIPKYSIVGAVKDQFLIALEDMYLNAGTSQEFSFVVGTLKEEIITVNATGPKLFRFEKKTVSEDCRILLNSVEVVKGSRLIEASEGKFIVMGNPFDSVDVLYLNQPSFTTQYALGDELKLEFVELFDLDFELSDVTFDYGDITASEITTAFQEAESTEEIKINAPIFNDTQYIIRARADYVKLLRILATDILDANFKNVSPMVVGLLYVRDDLTYFSPAQEAELLEKLSANRGMGLEPPTFLRCTRNPVELQITVKLVAPTPDIVTKINAIVAPYEKKLKQALPFDDIENQIEDIQTVKTARVAIKPKVWTANGKYEVGEFIRPIVDNGLIFKMVQIKYFSGATEPAWPTTEGATIEDNGIIWRCKYLERQCDVTQPLIPIIPPRDVWMPNFSYPLKYVVIPSTLDIYEYEAIAFVNKSGSTEPTWSTDLGSSTQDGNVVWQARELEGATPSVWVANKNYEKGDLVSSSAHPTLMFQCVAFLGTTGSSEPAFTNVALAQYIDNNVEWKALNPLENLIPLAVDHFYLIKPTITLL